MLVKWWWALFVMIVPFLQPLFQLSASQYFEYKCKIFNDLIYIYCNESSMLKLNVSSVMEFPSKTFFFHLVYIWDSVVITALLVISVGTFAIAIPSFATANQHKYGYRGWLNRNLAIQIQNPSKFEARRYIECHSWAHFIKPIFRVERSKWL